MNVLRTKKSKIIFTVVALAIVAVAIAIILKMVLNPTDDSATKVGFSEKSSSTEWSATYSLLDGRLEKKFVSTNDKSTLVLEFSTDEGELDFFVFDSEGYCSESEGECFEIVGNGQWTVEIDGEVTVRLDARNHKGSYSITLR